MNFRAKCAFLGTVSLCSGAAVKTAIAVSVPKTDHIDLTGSRVRHRGRDRIGSLNGSISVPNFDHLHGRVGHELDQSIALTLTFLALSRNEIHSKASIIDTLETLRLR